MFSTFLVHLSHLFLTFYICNHAYLIFFQKKPIICVEGLNEHLEPQDQNNILAGFIIFCSFLLIFEKKIPKIFRLFPLIVILGLTFHDRTKNEYFNAFHLADIIALLGIFLLFFSKNPLEKSEKTSDVVINAKKSLLIHHIEGNKIKIF